jgi:hypothetical protein
MFLRDTQKRCLVRTLSELYDFTTGASRTLQAFKGPHWYSCGEKPVVSHMIIDDLPSETGIIFSDILDSSTVKQRANKTPQDVFI